MLLFKIITKVELGLLEGLFMGMKTTNDYSLIIVMKWDNSQNQISVK
jgi:hypothetical protein